MELSTMYKSKKAKKLMLRCFVPMAARFQAMKVYHDEAAHIGWDKAIVRMREDLYWPKMGKTLKKYIRNCRACAVGKSHTGPKHSFYQKGEKAQEPLQIWHIDHAGPLVKSNNCTEILVAVDAFSKLCMFVPIKNKTTKSSVAALEELFIKIGKPKKIVADRARAFTSPKFRNFL
ncbi:Integrase core domain [Popillia japonica]|uniref:RNA-directed DNA polymerase n=1 Tax=Popillia japonica TaxID=7064 RepID=A0AAW1IA30_POPJA